MNDLLPTNTILWHKVESILKRVGKAYGYQEIRTPILEKTDLFRQSIGDETDIVKKEMFTFTDAGDEDLTLRPEATASTVRACLQHGLLHNQQHRLWYLGPMFRRERPQKGRFRQFHQFGVEAFGWKGPDIDAEIILLGERIWKELQVDGVKLHLNSLGSDASRQTYISALKAYLAQHKDDLDADSIHRLEKNPLRVLDSKDADTREIVAGAPSIGDYLQVEERACFDQLRRTLDENGVDYVVDQNLVRGLDYYTSTVFEWITDQLGAQATVCGGGRYDSLVENRGGNCVPGIGFALGLERLIELVSIQNKLQHICHEGLYLIDLTTDESAGVSLAEELRNHGLKVISHCGGGKLKSSLKRADKSSAKLAVIIGDREKESGLLHIKQLREDVADIQVPQEELILQLSQFLN